MRGPAPPRGTSEASEPGDRCVRVASWHGAGSRGPGRASPRQLLLQEERREGERKGKDPIKVERRKQLE